MKRHTPFGVEVEFFNAPRDSSRVKRQIVTEYFNYYMRVMARNGKTAGYVDLFAGPGIYDVGEESIPILICRQVVAEERLRTSVKLWFNEGDPDNYAKLKANIAAVPGIATLTHRPRITAHIIADGFAPELAKMRTPSFIFADPCGYKGLSLHLIGAALKPYGNDCLFFFNYNRLNMKLGYDVMNDSVNSFFEASRAERIRDEIRLARTPHERERIILSAVAEALKQVQAYPLAYGFRTLGGSGTSHHLVYATKLVKALNQMKRIFTKASTDNKDGVGSLDYDPRDADASLPLFSGLDEVRQRLIQTFAGQTLTFEDLIAAEAAETSFTDSNYRNALLDLEDEQRVTMEPTAPHRPFQAGGRRRTLARHTLIAFPELEEGN